MNKKNLLFFITIALCTGHMIGMDKAITIEYFSNKENIPGKIKNLFENKQYTQYGYNSLGVNEKGIIKAYNNAIERGADVKARLGTHSMTDFSLLPGVKRDSNEHSKNCVGIGKNIDGQKISEIIVTSANGTNNAYHNHETALKITNDNDLAQKMLKFATSDSPTKKIKDKTPDTPTKKIDAYSSKHISLNDFWARRIKSFADKEGENGTLELCSMNVNAENTKDAILYAMAKKVNVSIAVNKTSLTSNGLLFLQAIEDKKKGSVLVDCYQGHSCMHKKTGTFNGEKTKHYCTSTGNFTDQGDSEKNVLTWVNDEATATAASEHFKTMIKSFKTLSEAIEIAEERKAVKRTLFTENNIQPKTKRKKTEK